MDDYFSNTPSVPSLSSYSFFPRADFPADCPDNLYLRYFFPRLPPLIPSLLQPLGDSHLILILSFPPLPCFLSLNFVCCFIFTATSPVSPALSEISSSSLPLHRIPTPRPPPPPYNASSSVSSATHVVSSSPRDTPMDVGSSPSLVPSVDANMLSLAHGFLTSLPSSTSFVSSVVSSSSHCHQNVFGHISPVSSVSDSHTSSTLPYVTPSLDEALPLQIDLSPLSSPTFLDSMPFMRYPLAVSPTSSVLPPLLSSNVPPPKDVDIDVVSLHAGDGSFLVPRLLYVTLLSF